MKAYLCSLTQTGLAATVPVLERILQNGHEIDWDHRPDPDRFSLREMLAHWADMDAEWIKRINAILQSPGDAALEGKDPDALAQQNNYGALDPMDSLNRMANHRQKLLGILAGLSEAQWAQEGTHSEYGAMSVFDIAQFALGHDGYHLKQTIEWVA